MNIPVSATTAAANTLRRVAWEVRRRTGHVPGEYIPKTLLRPYLPSAPIIVDCGAHDGSDTCETARLMPQATIHAFEPVPQVFEKLSRNTRDFPNIRCHQIALAGRNGTATMHVSSGGTDAASSLLTPKEHLRLAPGVLFPQTCPVDCVTLDTWAQQEMCPRVDLLWLDMQGSELAVLKASPKILGMVRVIHLEVLLTELYQNNPLLPEVQQWLESQGFRRKFLALDRVERGKKPTGGNAVFIRQRE